MLNAAMMAGSPTSSREPFREGRRHSSALFFLCFPLWAVVQGIFFSWWHTALPANVEGLQSVARPLTARTVS